MRDCKSFALLFARVFLLFCVRKFDCSAADDMICRDHAREAVRFWTAVVERTGSSKFDVGKAREQLRNAQQVLRRKERPMF